MAMEETINNKIKILGITKVTPMSSDSSTTSFALPLTYFDTYWLKFHPGKCLLLYHITDLTSDAFNSVILPKLKQSLSLTLLHYLPLAGHMMWPSDAAKPAVYYFPNDGVSFTVAIAHDLNLFSLSSSGIREALLFRPLVPRLLILDEKAEVMAVQITLFPNQGFSIGISTHHALFDGKSAIMFIKSWAYMCHQILGQEQNPSLSPELTPCFDRTGIKDPEGIDMVYVKHWMMQDSTPRSFKLVALNMGDADSTNFVRMAFELTREDIKKLRDKVLSAVDEQSKDIHLSTYVLTCAYVYICMVKAMGKEANTPIGFRVGIDCRTRFDPPLPDNYFGNCVCGVSTTAKASDFMEENGIAFVAEKLSDLIKGLKGDVIVGSEEKIVNLLTALKGVQLQTGLPGISGSNRFDFYGSDFGWGKPKKVEIMSIDKARLISLVHSINGDGGVEVGVVLEKQQMEVFASLFGNGLKDL